MDYAWFAELAAEILDLAAVLAILAGTVVSTGQFAKAVKAGAPFVSAYERFRHALGRAIIVGLEFLIAGDIIRTVVITPTLESVAVLAGIVVVRSFISFSLQMEIEHRWPWQAGKGAAGDGDV